MPDPLLVQVYPGCTIEVTDAAAFMRNPLRQNPLVGFKDHPTHEHLFFADAHVSSPDTPEAALVDVCVRCHPYAFGPLCNLHRDGGPF